MGVDLEGMWECPHDDTGCRYEMQCPRCHAIPDAETNALRERVAELEQSCRTAGAVIKVKERRISDMEKALGDLVAVFDDVEILDTPERAMREIKLLLDSVVLWNAQAALRSNPATDAEETCPHLGFCEGRCAWWDRKPKPATEGEG